TSPCGRHEVARWRVGLPAVPPADLCCGLPDVSPGGPQSQALREQGRRRTLVPRGTGVGWRAVWWLRAPTPPVGRCAPLLVGRAFTLGCVPHHWGATSSTPPAGCCGVFLPPRRRAR